MTNYVINENLTTPRQIGDIQKIKIFLSPANEILLSRVNVVYEIHTLLMVDFYVLKVRYLIFRC